jgi:hypothetical protein
MKIICQIIFLTIILFLCFNLYSFAEEPVLSPKAALETALKNNLRIQAANTSIPISEATLIVGKYRLTASVLDTSLHRYIIGTATSTFPPSSHSSVVVLISPSPHLPVLSSGHGPSSKLLIPCAN